MRLKDLIVGVFFHLLVTHTRRPKMHAPFFSKVFQILNRILILSTIFLVIFALMLASFIINVLIFKDEFSIIGLVSVIITFLADLGVVFYLTRPGTKTYFEKEK